MAKQPKPYDFDAELDALPKTSNEFFYLDDDDIKQDASMHGPILNPVDYPIDEKIMGPIREKYRGRSKKE